MKCRQFGPKTKCSGCKTEPGIHGVGLRINMAFLIILRWCNDTAGNDGNNGYDGDNAPNVFSSILMNTFTQILMVFPGSSVFHLGESILPSTRKRPGPQVRT